MLRPAPVDAIAREEEGSTHLSLGTGGTACLAGTHGTEAGEAERAAWPRAFTGVLWGGKGEAGRGVPSKLSIG